MPHHDALRILLIQARDEAEILEQEQECFAERCRVRRGQIRAVNVVTGALELEHLDGVDAVLIGGSGAYSVPQDYPWMPGLLAFIREVRARKVPCFGSCWGHQAIARALGGRVIRDDDKAEMGCGEVILTEAGQSDALFGAFPSPFNANMGHHDRVTVLPPGAVELAYNASQRNQAFRVEGAPMYGTQFHSELDARRERERLVVYRAHYEAQYESEAQFQAIIDSLADTSEVDHLLYDFLQCFATREA